MKLALGAAGGLRFATPAAPAPPAPPAPPLVPKAQRPRVEKARVSVDPKLKAAARELRDRCLERVNEGGWPVAASGGKYDVSRGSRPLLTDRAEARPIALLKAG
jgi:hypothetical protein